VARRQQFDKISAVEPEPSPSFMPAEILQSLGGNVALKGVLVGHGAINS
jgi:hypothetical protein